MKYILFVLSLTFCSLAFAEDITFETRSFSHRVVLTQEDIKESSYTDLTELLASVGMHVVNAKPRASIGARGFSGNDVTFIVDGVRVADSSGGFDISTFDIFAINTIEISFSGYTADLLSPPGAIVKITTVSDLNPKLNFDILAKTFASGFDRAQLSLSGNIGLSRSSVGISAHGKIGPNAYKYSENPQNPYSAPMVNEGILDFSGGGNINYFMPLSIGSFRASVMLNANSLTAGEEPLQSLSGIFFADSTLNFGKEMQANFIVSSVLFNDNYTLKENITNSTEIKANFKFAPVKQVVLSADVSGNFDFLKNDAKMLYGFRAGVGAIWQPHENIRLELPLHFYWFNGDYLLSPKLNAGFFWPKVFFSLAAYPVWSHRETTYLGRDIFRKGENGYGAEITVGSPVVPLTLSVYTVYLRKILMGTATTVGDNLVISMANNGKQISLGGTISADIPITPNFDLKAGYSFIYTSIFEGNINFLGSSALNLPQHIFILGFNAKLGNLRINLLSKMYSERFIGDTPDENLPAYFLVDLALRYRISNFDIYLKTENTLDKRYWGNLAVPGESFGITLGCNYTFR